MKNLKKPFLFVSLAALILLFSACVIQPIKKISDQTAPPGYSAAKIAQAIKNGCAIKKWHATQIAPGVIQAKMNKKAHFYVTVNIPYSSKGYSIKYVSSRNLKAKDGRIHRAYNRWVSLLNDTIQHQLRAEHSADADNSKK